MTKFLVFTGPHGSGKSTAAAALGNALTTLRHKVRYDSFSFPVVAYTEYLFADPLPDRSTDPIELLGGKSLRDFIQREQQHMRFNYGPRILGQLLKARVEQVKPDYCIVDDGNNVNDVNGLGTYTLIDVARKSIESAFPFTIPGADIYIRNDKGLNDLSITMRQLAIKLTEEAQPC